MQYMRIMFLTGLAVALLLAGCSGNHKDSHADTTPRTIKARPATASVPADPTYEAIVHGPGVTPVAAQDLAPRLFKSYPGLLRELQTAVPATLWEQRVDDYLIVGIDIRGASKQGDTVDLYVDISELWWALEEDQLVESTGRWDCARIRLKRWGDSFRLSAIDYPGELTVEEPIFEQLFPPWARRLVYSSDRPGTAPWLEAAIKERALAWYLKHTPKDLFIDQSPHTIPDPHDHQPPSSAFEMLNPKYVNLRFERISKSTVNEDTSSPNYPGYPQSTDGRFHLHDKLRGDSGTVLEDTRKGVCYFIRAPGSPYTNCNPVWRGHILFIDYATAYGIADATTVHYEIDCDKLKVVRAVPMGPFSLNDPVNPATQSSSTPPGKS